MKLLQKEYFGIKTYQLLLVLFVAFLGVIFGSFYDLDISLAIANPENGFGRFFETLGETLGYAMAPIIGAILFHGFYGKENSAIEKIAGVVFALATIGVAGYYYGGAISSFNGYGLFDLPKVAAYIVSYILMIGFFIGSYFLIDKKANQAELRFRGILMLVIYGLTLLAVNILLKRVGYRPRYRAMVYDNPTVGTLAMGLSHYQEWWQFNWFKKPDWFTSNTAYADFSDYIKSWPSGHTATASTLMLLPIAIEVSIFKDKKYAKTIGFFIGFVYAIVVAFARIIAGAHFLSDVSWAMLFFLFFTYLTLKVGDILRNKALAKENPSKAN